VRDQQIEVGARLLASTEPSARVLVGDAGAIPFVSQRTAIDALGLGGFHHLPFARAAANGEAATIELIERLSPEERPTHLALYPNWFGGLTRNFGEEIDRVTIMNNVICGGPTKAIYRADWSTLARTAEKHEALIVDDVVDPAKRADASLRRIVDEIDIADVVSEGEHAYVAPTPRGGFTTFDVRALSSGKKRFDGGRIIPQGEFESFVVARGTTKGTRLRVRTDEAAAPIHAYIRGIDYALLPIAHDDGTWREDIASIATLAPGDTITLHATTGAYRDYHVWIEAEDEVASIGR
jgi:hypothetical protein